MVTQQMLVLAELVEAEVEAEAIVLEAVVVLQ